jgi:predicted transcriptional regulator
LLGEHVKERDEGKGPQASEASAEASHGGANRQRGGHGVARSVKQGEEAMSKVLELSEETYQQLTDLAQQQQRTPEEMLRVCLATYEAARYARVHQQMIAEGLLAAVPTRPLPPEVESFDPEEIPGPPLSETILEERR